MKRKSKPEILTSNKKSTSKKSGVTKVNFLNYIKTEWITGKRTTIGFKGNLDLYREFKPVSKALYGSTCRAFEFFMASLVTSSRQKVNFSLTTNPITIENIVIERNLRPRRKLELKEETPVPVNHEELELCKPETRLNKRFGRVVEQWSLHPDRKWRETWLVNAKGYPELENAKRVLELSQELEVV